MFLNIYCEETQHFKKYIFSTTLSGYSLFERASTHFLIKMKGNISNNFQFVRSRGKKTYLFSKLLFCYPTAQV